MTSSQNLELLLREMYEAMSELSLVLDFEYDALSTQDADKLQDAAVKKDALSSKIQILENTRAELLTEYELKNNLDSMKILFAKYADSENSHLFKIWNMISELTEECAAKNKLNGIIIEAKRRHTNTAIALLQGKQDEDSDLYASDGSKIQKGKNSTIARA